MGNLLGFMSLYLVGALLCIAGPTKIDVRVDSLALSWGQSLKGNAEKPKGVDQAELQSACWIIIGLAEVGSFTPAIEDSLNKLVDKFGYLEVPSYILFADERLDMLRSLVVEERGRQSIRRLFGLLKKAKEINTLRTGYQFKPYCGKVYGAT